MTDDTERITVGEEAESGEPVSLPVIDVLAGRGFITGKSGSGKSNTASVVAEQLLEAGYGLLIVDVDGEYYGLKEEYELLHAGADEECDIQVSPEHAEKLATLALEENVPIILDVSSYLDPEDADEMLLAVARQLFAKAKKQKKPFLVLVEECHEYIPEGGGMTETGKMLIKIGKRGRKHGLGIVGMSQRPADVKKDFITQCDWMGWHRLTWDNDTRVVGRILGGSYADRVEDLGDGEAFFDADWNEDVLRVQFDRKQTFDAGATPGLGEFERPELQSVSADLVADLQQVSEERERHESEVASLEAKLAEKEQRIEELEAELAEARDMSEMADKFAQALVENAEAAPSESAPAEPEVAEAEEFVADAARHGYPGERSVPSVDRSASGHAGGPGPDVAVDGEPASDAESTSRGEPPDADAEWGPEQLSEDQRELHDYEVDGEGAPDQQDADSPSPEAADARNNEPTVDQPAVDDIADTSESDGVDSLQTATHDDEPSSTEASGDDADTVETAADGSAKSETSGLQPVTTVSDRSTTEDGDGNGPAADEQARATETSEEDREKSPSDGVENEAAEEGSDNLEPAPEPDEEAVADDAKPAGRDDMEEQSSSEGESDSRPDRPTIQATGDWPQAGDTDRAAEPDPDLEPAPDVGAETTEELKQQLSEEYGVRIETHSDLTGGSLSSTAAESQSTNGADSTEPTEPVEADTEQEAPELETDEHWDGSTPSQRDTGESDTTASASTGRESADAPAGAIDPTADRGARLTELVEGTELRDEEGVVRAFVHGIDALDRVTRGMLEHYRQSGDDSPLSAHVAAGGSGERQYAYARNRTLRKAGLVEHVGGGRYRYRLRDLVDEAFEGRIDDRTRSRTVSAIEAATGIVER